ncbi:MAG: hypothetical protein QXL88_01885 [Candidatus Pacearchaeota archaeon]
MKEKLLFLLQLLSSLQEQVQVDKKKAIEIQKEIEKIISEISSEIK